MPSVLITGSKIAYQSGPTFSNHMTTAGSVFDSSYAGEHVTIGNSKPVLWCPHNFSLFSYHSITSSQSSESLTASNFMPEPNACVFNLSLSSIFIPIKDLCDIVSFELWLNTHVVRLQWARVLNSNVVFNTFEYIVFMRME